MEVVADVGQHVEEHLPDEQLLHIVRQRLELGEGLACRQHNRRRRIGDKSGVDALAFVVLLHEGDQRRGCTRHAGGVGRSRIDVVRNERGDRRCRARRRTAPDAGAFVRQVRGVRIADRIDTRVARNKTGVAAARNEGIVLIGVNGPIIASRLRYRNCRARRVPGSA